MHAKQDAMSLLFKTSANPFAYPRCPGCLKPRHPGAWEEVNYSTLIGEDEKLMALISRVGPPGCTQEWRFK